MGAIKNLTGQKFGRLTVVGLGEKPEGSKSKEKFWLCQCDCGNFVTVRGNSLRSGKTKSCGCITSELMKKKAKENPWKKHGLSDTRIYRCYYSMKERCYNLNRWNYDKYGGRGIRVCQEWLDDFMNFYNWAMANGYDDSKTIDRIDVNGNYEPSNCRWETPTNQQFNRNKQSNNTSGHIGVSQVSSGHYRAYIKKYNKQIPLGTYETYEEAVAAREKAEKEFY